MKYLIVELLPAFQDLGLTHKLTNKIGMPIIKTSGLLGGKKGSKYRNQGKPKGINYFVYLAFQAVVDACCSSHNGK